jgi:hypothetical protein
MRRIGSRIVVATVGVLLGCTALVGCGGGSTEDFCSVGDDIEAVDPTAADFDNEAFQDALADAVEAAPDDIKADVETLRDAFEGVDLSDPEAIADPDVIEKLSTPDLQEAGNRITAFTEDNC